MNPDELLTNIFAKVLPLSLNYWNAHLILIYDFIFQTFLTLKRLSYGVNHLINTASFLLTKRDTTSSRPNNDSA